MKKIKLLFLYANGVLQNPPPVSIAIFSALLRDRPEVEVRLFDTTCYNTEKHTTDQTKAANLQVKPYDYGERGIKLRETDVYADFVSTVSDYDPDLIAMSCNQVTFTLGNSLLAKVKEHRALKLVGGVYATFAPETVLAHDTVDMVCIGEGEGAIVDLVERLAQERDITGIPNLWLKDGAKIIKNSLRPLVDLDELPLPDYDIFTEERYYRPMDGVIHKLFPVETMRGCFYNCSYCNSPSARRLYEGYGLKNNYRKKSAARIDQELEYLTGKYKVEYIYFLSDMLLCLDEDEFADFCRVYEKYALPFWCQGRVEMITNDKVKRLREVGCRRMTLGVEHGDPKFRKNQLHRTMSNEQIVAAFTAINQAGIAATANNIIGFPGETRELAFATIRLNRQLTFDTTNATAFTPFRGTESYNTCIQQGYLDPGQSIEYVTKGSVLTMPQFPKEEINGLVHTFVLYSCLPEKYFPQIKIAERDDAAGREAFAELSKIYREGRF